MAKSDIQRKLTAILCADVVGYSRLMGADEEATIETLTAYRKVFLSHIKNKNGRVVDAKGDAILAEFASVVDAVNSAVEIQRELAEKNADLPGDRRMDFRIGINLGDVVVKDDVIYGDGVNVAARLESLAEPGGICISRPVHDQVRAKVNLGYEYLGERKVKNIAEPVRAYRVLTRPGDPATAGETFPLILALDVGSSATRCLAFDSAGNPLRGVQAQRSHRPRLSLDGGVELDAPALLKECLDCLEAVAAQLQGLGREILGVGVCTFWHSFLGVDAGGSPVTPIYMWNDIRSASSAMMLRDQLDGQAYHARTGCVLHPSYLPARLHWLGQNDARRYERCARFISFGEYLELYLFGETRCGLSMASATGLLDQTRGDWDTQMLDLLELPRDALAPLEIAPAARRGYTRQAAKRLPALKSTPFFAAIGDGAASNLGLGATTEECAGLMISSGAAMRTFHTGSLPEAPEGLWRYQLDSRRALVGGALSNGGNLVGWLLETLRLPAGRKLEDLLMEMPPAAHGLRILPFFRGERNPGYPLDATGAIAGLRGSTTPLQIYQASMEAVAYRLLAIWGRLQSGRPGIRGFIAGGLLRSPVWARLLADVLGQPLHISKVAESSSRGTALFALEALGLLPDAHLLPPPLGKTIVPDPARHAVYQEAYAAHLELHERLD